MSHRFTRVCSRISSMTESKIRKRIFDINLGPVRNKTRKKSAILLTDSKGKYISEQISTESFLDFQIASKPSIKIETPETAEFIWSILKNLLQYQDKAIIFLWLGTCDFTIKSHTTKLITLRYTTLNYKTRIQKLIDCLLKYKRQIETRYKYSRVILLECPPVSIIRHNKDKGHKHPEIFHNQNEKLEKQLKLFNSLVQDINLSCCPKAKNTVQFIYMSPNFTKDIHVLHKTKGSKGSKGKNRIIQYYINYPLLIDGVQPSELLSKLWLRRICNKVALLCY